MHSRHYVSALQASALLGISKRWMNQRLTKGEFAFELRPDNGGETRFVFVDSLPPEAQKKYYESLIPRDAPLPLTRASGPAAPNADSATDEDREADTKAYVAAPAWARKPVDKYLPVLQASEGLTGNTLCAFIETWNKAHPEKKTSFSALRHARIHHAAEGVAGLLAKYGKRAGVSIVPDNLFEEFKRLYLVECGPSVDACRLNVLGFAKQQGMDVANFPCSAAFDKRLKREIPEQALYLARHGHKKWNRKFASYVERDDSNIRAGDVWVSDHHQLDVAVINPETGKPCFPWLTVWRDYKSGKWLSWLLHCTDPNSDHIFYTFYLAVLKYGLPKRILIDNGRDYRCRDFAGGRSRAVKVEGNEDDQKRRTTLSLLGVNVHFATVFNAQAKPIERDFRSLINMFCKFCVGYRGSNITERPEKLAEETKSGAILSFSEFEPLFNTFIEESFNNRVVHGKNHKGKSPNQVMAEEFLVKREAHPEAVSLFCMRESGDVKIGRNGLTDSKYGLHYWAEAFSGMKGKKVYMRRDQKNLGIAWIFDAVTEEFICIAHEGQLTAKAFVDGPADIAQLRSALAAKRKDLRITKAFANSAHSTSIADHVSRMKLATQETSGGAVEANPKIHRLPNSKYDRIVKEKKFLDERGTFDISHLVPPKGREEIPYFLTDTDQEIWLQDPHNREIWNRENGVERQLPILESDKEQKRAG